MTDKNIDKAKGRAKEAAGALSGNQRLKDEGAATRPCLLYTSKPSRERKFSWRLGAGRSPTIWALRPSG